MGDLPGHLVAITRTCTKKLDRFDEIGTHGKRNFESIFFEIVFQLLEEIIVYQPNLIIKFNWGVACAIYLLLYQIIWLTYTAPFHAHMHRWSQLWSADAST